MQPDTAPFARFKAFVELLRDIATIVALSGTLAFFVSPPFERFIKESFGTKAWYFATELAINTQIAPGQDSGPILFQAGANNFYHFLWSRRNDFPGRSVGSDQEAVDYMVATLERIKGDIVYATVSNDQDPVPGRAEPHVVSPIKTLAQTHACFRILDTLYRKGQGSHPHNIYLELVRTPCQ